MQRFVDVAALSETFALNIAMLDSFAACQIHDVELGLFHFHQFFLLYLGLNDQREDDMRPRTLGVHAGAGHFSSLVSFQQRL